MARLFVRVFTRDERILDVKEKIFYGYLVLTLGFLNLSQAVPARR